MARSNYQFNKRQKELARKKKKEEKRQRKLDKNFIKSEENPNQSQLKKVALGSNAYILQSRKVIRCSHLLLRF